jgi:hypothetical protein
MEEIIEQIKAVIIRFGYNSGMFRTKDHLGAESKTSLRCVSFIFGYN